MSLSRAFTTRRLRLGGDSADVPKVPKIPQRANTGKDIRNKISAPVQLIHTTNMLSYNAPDLPRSARSLSSFKSDEDSDTATNAESTPPTSPDVAPGERYCSPEPNHLSEYFLTATKAALEPAFAATLASDSEAAPAIPKRSPSHTKKNSYEAIARQRSMSRTSRDSELSMSAKGVSTFSRSPSTSTRASSTSHLSRPSSVKQTAPAVPLPPAPVPTFQKDAHPFGQELAQVTELVEEIGAGRSLSVIDEEDQYLQSRGLVKWAADDYLSAIQSLSSNFFPELRNLVQTPAPLWI